MWTSVPQIVVSVTLTIASVGPQPGTGTSSSSMRPGPWKTAARIVVGSSGVPRPPAGSVMVDMDRG